MKTIQKLFNTVMFVVNCILGMLAGRNDIDVEIFISSMVLTIMGNVLIIFFFRVFSSDSGN